MRLHHFIPLFFILGLSAAAPMAQGSSPIVLPRVVADASNDLSGKSRWVGVLSGEFLAFRLQAATVPLLRYEQASDVPEKGRVDAQCELSRDGKTFHLYAERLGPALLVFEQTVPIERFGQLLDSCAMWMLREKDTAECTRLTRSLAMNTIAPELRQLHELGRLCTSVESGDRSALITAAEQALALFDADSRNLVARYLAAAWLDRAGEWPRAYRLYTELLMIVPEDAGLYALQAAAARHYGNSAGAIAAARAAEARKLRTPALMLEGARAMESQGKYEAAAKIASAVLAKDSGDAGAWEFSARCHVRMNQPALALVAADRAVSLFATPGAFLQKGRALVALGRSAEADESLLKATADPASAREAWPLLAQINAASGNSQKALLYYDEALKADAGNLPLCLAAAEYARSSGDAAAALAILERARGRFASSAELDRHIAEVRFALCDTVQSVRFYEQALEKNKGDTLALLALGKLYGTLGSWDRAINVANRLVALVRDRVPAQMLLGSAYLHRGDFRAAVSNLSAVQKKNPGDTAVAHLLGMAWYRLGNGSEAAVQYRKLPGMAVDAACAAEAADAFFLASDWQSACRQYAASEKILLPARQLKWAIAHAQLRNMAEAARIVDLLPAAGFPGDLSFRAAELFDRANDPLHADRLYQSALMSGVNREMSLTALLRIETALHWYSAAALRAEDLASFAPDRYRGMLYTAGELFESADSAAAAARAYERFIATGTPSTDALIRLSRIRAAEGDNGSLVRLCGMLKPSQADRADDMIVFGCALMQAGRSSEAELWFQECTKKYPAIADGWEGLALSAQNIGDSKTALSANRKLLDLGSSGTRTESAWRTAQIYETAEDRAAALEQYRSNIRLFPEDLRNYDRFIELCRAAHLPADARDAALKAAELSGGDPAHLKLAGDLQRELNDQASAIRFYERYVAARPGDGSVHAALGALYLERGRCELSVVQYALADSLAGGTHATSLKLGHALACNREFLRAAIAFERALSFAGKDVDTAALNGLVDVRCSAGDVAGLENALKRRLDAGLNVYSACIDLSDLAMGRGDAAAACSWRERALRMAPDSICLHIRLAGIYVRMNNRPAAYSHLRQALAKAPLDREVNAALAVWYIRSGQYAAADEILSRFALEEPLPGLRYARALQALARSQRKGSVLARGLADEFSYIAAYRALDAVGSALACDTAAAIAGAKRALSLDMNDPDVLADAGRALVHVGEVDSGMKYLSAAIAADRRNPVALEGLGDGAFFRDRYAAAAGYYTAARKAGNLSASIDVRLGRSYALMNQPLAARKVFEAVLVRNGDNREAFYRLLNTAQRDSLSFCALFKAHISEVRSGTERTVWDHLVDGLRFETEHNFDAAQISYDVALRLSPDLPEAVAGRGRILIAREDWPAAVEVLGRAYAADPYNPYLMLDMATAFEGIGSPEAALSFCKTVADRFPAEAEGWYRMAILQSQAADHVSAAKSAVQAVLLSPKDPRMLYFLGVELTATNDAKGAVAAYTRSAQYGGKAYVEAWLAIAELYRTALGDPKQAERAMKRYAEESGASSVDVRVNPVSASR